MTPAPDPLSWEQALHWDLEQLASFSLDDPQWTPAVLKREMLLRGLEKYTPNDVKRCKTKVQAMHTAAEKKAAKQAAKDAAAAAKVAAAAAAGPPKLPWDYNDEIALAHCMVHPNLAMAVANYHEGLMAEDVDGKHVPRCPFEEDVPNLYNSKAAEDILTKAAISDPGLGHMDPELRHRGHDGTHLKSR